MRRIKMLRIIKEFWKDESGLGTVEIVVILAVLVSIALIFRTQVIGFVRNSLNEIFGGTDTSVVNE
jgi:Flp pilus assembly pilin Flp